VPTTRLHIDHPVPRGTVPPRRLATADTVPKSEEGRGEAGGASDMFANASIMA